MFQPVHVVEFDRLGFIKKYLVKAKIVKNNSLRSYKTNCQQIPMCTFFIVTFNFRVKQLATNQPYGFVQSFKMNFSSWDVWFRTMLGKCYSLDSLC